MKEPIKYRGGCERLFSRSHIAQKYCEICKPKSDDMEVNVNGLKCLIVSKDKTICQLEKCVIQLKLIITEKFIEACKYNHYDCSCPWLPSPGKSITTQSLISYANSVTRRLTSPTEGKESNEHSIILKPTIPMTNNSKLNLKEINNIKTYRKIHLANRQ